MKNAEAVLLISILKLLMLKLPIQWTEMEKARSSTRISMPVKQNLKSTGRMFIPDLQKCHDQCGSHRSRYQQYASRYEIPRYTEEYEGFYHLLSIHGDEGYAIAEYIIRDHDTDSFEARKIHSAISRKP